MFEGSMGIKLMNPLNNSLEAASIEMKFNSTINMTIGHDFEMKGAVDKMNISVTKVKALFKSDVTVKTLSAKAKAIKDIAIQTINQELNEGLKFPLPGGFFNGLTQSTL